MGGRRNRPISDPVADDLGADLDQLLAQAGQRPQFRRLGHRQRPHESTEVIGKRMELKADGVGGKGTARQLGPLKWRPCLL